MRRIADRSVDRNNDTEETDRDSDDTLEQIRDAEKEAKRYKEMADRSEEVARIKKKSLKQRHLRRTSQPGSECPGGTHVPCHGRVQPNIYNK